MGHISLPYTYADCHLPKTTTTPQLHKARGCKEPSEMFLRIFREAHGGTSLRDP